VILCFVSDRHVQPLVDSRFERFEYGAVVCPFRVGI